MLTTPVTIVSTFGTAVVFLIQLRVKINISAVFVATLVLTANIFIQNHNQQNPNKTIDNTGLQKKMTKMPAT